METKKISQIVIRFSIIITIILMILTCSLFFYIDLKQQKSLNGNKLIEIVEYEIDNANVTGNCYNYSEYYNQSFRKYPELDVRWENRNVDICNGLTLCNSTHTFVIVNGYFSSCIVDQTKFACVKVR